MMENIKEIIGRTTMALVAIALAWAATGLVIFAIKSISDITYGSLLFALLALILYIVAFTLVCFVFASRDPHKAQVGRVMTWADKISEGMSQLVTALLKMGRYW